MGEGSPADDTPVADDDDLPNGTHEYLDLATLNVRIGRLENTADVLVGDVRGIQKAIGDGTVATGRQHGLVMTAIKTLTDAVSLISANAEAAKTHIERAGGKAREHMDSINTELVKVSSHDKEIALLKAAHAAQIAAQLAAHAAQQKSIEDAAAVQKKTIEDAAKAQKESSDAQIAATKKAENIRTTALLIMAAVATIIVTYMKGTGKLWRTSTTQVRPPRFRRC